MREALLDTTPLAAQTMVYFKPPGSRGQALHQDQYFLRARPGTTLAVWLALDDCDDANGCIRVVPGSQDWPLLCPEPADTRVSFARDSIPLPPGTPELPIEMRAGDVLFFNGSLVHGSMPNVTADRFRRSLIAHFIEERATGELAKRWKRVVNRAKRLAELDPEARHRHRVAKEPRVPGRSGAHKSPGVFIVDRAPKDAAPPGHHLRRRDAGVERGIALPKSARRSDREAERIQDLPLRNAIEIIAPSGGDRLPDEQIPKIAVNGRKPFGRRIALAIGAAGVGGRPERAGEIHKEPLHERRIKRAVPIQPRPVRGE